MYTGIEDKYIVCRLSDREGIGTIGRKYEHGLSSLLYDDLHWLDVPEHSHFKLGVTVL